MLLKEEALSSVSIGCRVKDYEYKEDGGRVFKEIDLFETSVVLFPANPKAQITQVKDEDGAIHPSKLEKSLRDVGLSKSEAKMLLAKGLTELMQRRDVVTEAERKQDIAKQLIKTFGGNLCQKK